MEVPVLWREGETSESWGWWMVDGGWRMGGHGKGERQEQSGSEMK
jgi:hypothetical protein